ncbi:MAG TPA: hypothetical protein VEF72_05765, partial [Mycobacterium sp.]|nr:hypothetical protein [Mycobacterium sp.]
GGEAQKQVVHYACLWVIADRTVLAPRPVRPANDAIPQRRRMKCRIHQGNPAPQPMRSTSPYPNHLQQTLQEMGMAL